MPVLTVNVGRSAAGRRLARARAEKAASQLTRQALFEQAGLIATANLGELLDTVAMLATQPVPAENRVGVVANTRGGGMLAADACGDASLQVAILAEDTRRALRDLLPSVAAVAGPVDTTAGVAPGLFRRCLELVGADPGVDAVLAVTATTATSDLVSEVHSARLPVPLAASVMDQIEAVRLLPGPDENSPAVPAYAYPESAARALGHAARYGIWRAAPHGSAPELEGLRRDQARKLVTGFLAGSPRGGWLSDEQTTELLGCYGVRLADHVTVTTEEAASAAAARFGGPVAVKANVPGLVRRSQTGAVLLGLDGAEEVRRGFRTLRRTFGNRLAGVIVQPMITGEVKVKINVLEEEVLGPLVLFGLAGAAADVLGDRAARLAPLTEADADDLIRPVGAAWILLGRHGASGADLTSVKSVLLRVSQIADDLAQIAELELNPIVALANGAEVLDARVRIRAADPVDAYLRQLR
jgi:acyl-CoA synthetase (NDP forming)